jgi:hypothetical protein
MNYWLKNKEYKLCENSFVYFCEKYIRLYWHLELDDSKSSIKSASGIVAKNGFIPFKLYDYQIRFIEQLENNHGLIGKKFRQAGFSNLMVAYHLWLCMFKEHESCMQLFQFDRMALHASYIFKYFVEQLPDWLKPDFEINNDHQKKFKNGSVLYFLTPLDACGKSISNLYLDELAYWKNPLPHWKALYPTIKKGGKVVILSTPNGKNNLFHDFYSIAEQAEQGQHNCSFKPYSCSHEEHPLFQLPDWSFKMRALLGDKSFRTEVLCEFLD